MNRHVLSSSRRLPPVAKSRKGNIVVLTALMLVVLLAMIAFAVDVGYMSVVSTEIQSSVDAAALAGAGALSNGPGQARKEALNYLGMNAVGRRTLDESNAKIELGQWNSATRVFTPIRVSPSAVRVTATSQGQPLFFGRVLGQEAFSTTAKAVAIFRPRDVILVLDYSGR